MLPFTLDTLYATIEAYNRALWPAPLAGFTLAALLLWIVARMRPGATRISGALLAAAWLGAGVGFHWHYFAQINFAAPAYAGLFVVQAVLLIWFCVVRGTPAFRVRPDIRGIAGVFLVAASATLWPLIVFLMRGSWVSVPLPGSEPTATVLLTLGMLLFAHGRAAIALAVIPVLWMFAEGATYFVLDAPAGLVFPGVGLAVAALLVFKRHRPVAGMQEDAPS